MKIGKIIHYYRKRNSMTQEELAFRLGVSGTTVSKWENDLSYPETSLLPKIADIFDISINQLFNNDFVLTLIIEDIIEEANNQEKFDLENSIIYLEKKCLEHPANENLSFEIARRYLLFFKETKTKELIKKATVIFERLIKSSDKYLSQWSKYFLSMIYSELGNVNQALAFNSELMLSEGLNPKLDKIVIKLMNGYLNIDKDINTNLNKLMEEYFDYWEYLYKYYYDNNRFEDILREGLKYIGIIINFIGKDKSIFFNQLSVVYHDLGIAYYKVNNKMRSDECFISALLYASKYDELEHVIVTENKILTRSNEKQRFEKKLEYIKNLIKNNEEKEIKDKLSFYLSRIKF